MCGIAGFCLAPTERNNIDRRLLTAALLDQIESRGRDATGLATWQRGGKKISVRKRNVSATEYIRSGRVAEQVNRGTCTAIMHTRYATQGKPERNSNNHPIMRPPVVGVHNGHVSNDADLFKRLNVKRSAQVDSEAIFALLAHAPEPVDELLPRVQGGAAVAWLDKREARDEWGPTLHLARIRRSPLAVGQTNAGSVIFASTMPHLLKACDTARIDLDWTLDVGEAERMDVRRGVITTYQDIPGVDKAPALRPMRYLDGTTDDEHAGALSSWTLG